MPNGTSASTRRPRAAARKARPAPRFLNADLSRLAYNDRILQLASDDNVPLLERLRFLTYCSHNLDEFFMSRVGFLRDQLDAQVVTRTPDGLTPAERLTAIRAAAGRHLDRIYACLNEQLLPALQEHGIAIESYRSLSVEEQAPLRDHFLRLVAPLLTPIALDPGHPFPFLANGALNVAAVLESGGGEHLALMKIPPSLPRFFQLPDGRRFVPIGSLIAANLPYFFPSLGIVRSTLFRFLRNTELALDDDALDLRESMELELRRRDRKQVVCIEADARMDEWTVDALVRGGRAERADVYRVDGFLRVSDLLEICDRIPDAALRYPPFNPRIPLAMATTDDVFTVMRRGDILLHRPYDSFAPVIELLHAAATDPDVVALTQTLYQTDEGSPVVEKLILAANAGKQVNVVLELQARFEETRNLAIARRLRDAGVQVVYGVAGMKTHCKLTLVVRSEGDALRRYLHVSTGNYAVGSSRAYTDIDLLSCDESLCADASLLLNVLTGYSAATMADVFDGRERPHWKRFVVGPFDYRAWVLRMIAREAEHARAGRAAGIVAKLNALSDPSVIEALYAASSAGVPIELIVRGICCLIPGVPGVSETIRVTSVVDRFLEHSRLLQFENGGEREIHLSSGDWMPRNFDNRVELTAPLLDPALRARVAEQILPLLLADDAAAWTLQPDGSWKRRGAAEGAASVQQRFIDFARRDAVGVGDFEKTIAHAERFRRKARGRS